MKGLFLFESQMLIICRIKLVAVLLLLFVISGAIFLMSTNDLVSIFLAIELQSYGLYILSTVYRNSELSTTGGLIYFLLGGTAEWYNKLQLICLELSNSGDALKLKVSNYIWKVICGWTNHSCMVTTLKMKETKIGNRGSKSINTNFIVKELRVDGSCIILPMLRCTLMGFERNYQIRTLSNQINLCAASEHLKIFLTSKAQLVNPSILIEKQNIARPVNPWALTGFIDGEGSFIMGISKNKNKVGWQVKL